jgi:hypothetical protein
MAKVMENFILQNFEMLFLNFFQVFFPNSAQKVSLGVYKNKNGSQKGAIFIKHLLIFLFVFLFD